MILPAILNPFAENAPAAVMTRLALDWIMDGVPLDQLFDQVAETQYNREFTLTHLVQVMLDVASGYRPSPRAAFLKRCLERQASISAFYRKLARTEPALAEEIVHRTANRARQLIVASGGLMEEPIGGYSARILDGNVLAGTEHRLAPLRTIWSAGLPGISLAIYEPASGLVLDLILEEDGHSQERALVHRIQIEAGQLWIADRNFCVRSFLFRIADQGAHFLVRWHRSSLPFEPAGPVRACGRCVSGEVFEQPIDVSDGAGGIRRLRRIVLKLDRPTRDGETEIVLVTNLPADVTAIECCRVYAGRWQIEAHYQVMTDLLHCEVPTLGHPRAALFAFAMSAVAGNALAVLKGNLRVVHGEELTAEVSNYALVDDVAEVYPGMMIGVPPSSWPNLTGHSAAEVANMLNKLAERIPVERMFRSRRGPKKPRPKRTSGKRVHHVSIKKLLDQNRKTRAPAGEDRKSRNRKT